MDFSQFMKPQDLEGIELEHASIGLTIHYTVLCFNDSFNHSGKEFFTNFINEFGKVKKWIISSDYAFYDTNKKNDVVTFSIFPHLAHIKKCLIT